MSDFAVLTHALTVEPHPDADLLECVRIGGYFTVVRKDEFKTGDVAAYIPEAAIIPNPLIEGMGLTGKLAGPAHNRVHAVMLRGVLSQGLVYPMPEVPAGTNATEQLGIVKYQPVIPPHMQGDMQAASGASIRYEIADIKMQLDMFQPGEEAVFTEKIHGTWCAVGWQNRLPIMASKQISANGLSFIAADGANDSNIYVECFRANQDAIAAVGERTGAQNYQVLGEVYGKDIQDLTYGLTDIKFRVFDIYADNKEEGCFLDYGQMLEAVNGLFDTVPLLYRGPFNHEEMLKHTNGASTLGGNNREGSSSGQQSNAATLSSTGPSPSPSTKSTSSERERLSTTTPRHSPGPEETAMPSFYQRTIFEMDQAINSADVEASMRLQYGTLDHLPKENFRQEILLAKKLEEQEPGCLSSCADSFGLGSDFLEWENRMNGRGQETESR